MTGMRIAFAGPALLLLAFAPLPALAGTQVRVLDAWAPATLPGAPAGVAYLVLRNDGDAPAVLTGATCPQADQVSLRLQDGDGEIRLPRPVTAVPLPPGQPVGNLRLLLLGLHEPLAAGGTLPLTLHFRRQSDELTTSLRVLPLGTVRPAPAGR